jgi:selenide,water dikinase
VLPNEDANALVDASTGDDAAVYRLEPHRALVVTTDFFTPIVDDPYDFGQIAAANALSDIYAMGARPLFALNLVAFPRGELAGGSLERIIKGGAAKCREAGIPILGGHSIDDPEPKYGLVAIGEVDPDRMCTNDAARPGDYLLLTKPIGTGLVATAVKAGDVDPAIVAAATRSMATLNRAAAEAMVEAGVRAATDVTGFGLLGHLRQMALASKVSATVQAGAVPFLPGVSELAETRRFPGGSLRNRADLGEHVRFPPAMPEAARMLLVDAQTSGGLLMSVPEEAVQGLLRKLRREIPVAAVIGRIGAGPPGQIQIT